MGLLQCKDGNIIVAHHRNNRIQVFTIEEIFVLKFGCKDQRMGSLIYQSASILIYETTLYSSIKTSMAFNCIHRLRTFNIILCNIFSIFYNSEYQKMYFKNQIFYFAYHLYGSVYKKQDFVKHFDTFEHFDKSVSGWIFMFRFCFMCPFFSL